VSAPYRAVLQLEHFTSFVLNFQSNLLVKKVFWFELGTCKSGYGKKERKSSICSIFWRRSEHEIFLTYFYNRPLFIFGNKKYVHNVIIFFSPKCAFNLKCVVRNCNFVFDCL